LSFNGNNRITTSGYRYDAAGNLMMDGVNCYTYDAENRLSSVAPVTPPLSGLCGADTMGYLYGEGRRVARVQGGNVVKQYYYDAAGHMITEANASGTTLRAEIYAGNRHLATWSRGATYFNHADWLGTERARTNSSGTVCETITSLPFGDGATTSGSCTRTPTFFTGLERDTESNLDHTLNRQLSSNIGRWLTPDPAGQSAVHPDDPQTWNMYAYVRNNPTSKTDPTGLCTVDGETHNWVWCAAHAVGWVQTRQERNAEIETERNWLITNVARNARQAAALRGASGSQVQQLYRQWDSALMQAQCGGFWGCETWIPASGLRRAENGSFVPLTRLHSDVTITESNSASYQFWQNKTTAEIIESLKPGSEYGPLTVKLDGTVMQGNTRIKILEERGVDVNKLERVILETGEKILEAGEELP
jgi:RHS repeat-associated protein